jgi:hypothetical protein
MKTPRVIALAALLITAACGETPGAAPGGPMQMRMQTDAEAPGPAPVGQGGAPGHVDGHVDAMPAPAATGGAQGATGGAGGSAQVDAMPATGGRTGSDAGIPDATAADGGAGKPYAFCYLNRTIASVVSCNRPNPKIEAQYEWARKDGYRCVTCTFHRLQGIATDPVSGCLLPVTTGGDFMTDNKDPTPVLCVAACGECAY